MSVLSRVWRFAKNTDVAQVEMKVTSRATVPRLLPAATLAAAGAALEVATAVAAMPMAAVAVRTAEALVANATAAEDRVT
jgi:hypothetical protein